MCEAKKVLNAGEIVCKLTLDTSEFDREISIAEQKANDMCHRVLAMCHESVVKDLEMAKEENKKLQRDMEEYNKLVYMYRRCLLNEVNNGKHDEYWLGGNRWYEMETLRETIKVKLNK